MQDLDFNLKNSFNKNKPHCYVHFNCFTYLIFMFLLLSHISIYPTLVSLLKMILKMIQTL